MNLLSSEPRSLEHPEPDTFWSRHRRLVRIIGIPCIVALSVLAFAQVPLEGTYGSPIRADGYLICAILLFALSVSLIFRTRMEDVEDPQPIMIILTSFLMASVLTIFEAVGLFALGYVLFGRRG